MNTLVEGALAATRFGLGARPGEIETAAADPRGWLKAQIRPGGAEQPRGGAGTGPQRYLAFRRASLEARDPRRLEPPDPQGESCTTEDMASARTPRAPRRGVQRLLVQEAGRDHRARLRLAASTPTPFAERWALFFANHFSVAAAKPVVINLLGPFEREAIRPHVFGPFETLLLAAARHPAMLFYLDQAPSAGPGSVEARRAAQQGRRGLNENLARELLELHTVSVDGGYAQADVTELAAALTGWDVSGRGANARLVVDGPSPEGRGPPGVFAFRPAAHEPGARRVLGRTYPEGGADQAAAILRDLARDPRTARHVCRKLAAHFVADEPPPQLTARLERAWLDSDGALDEVARALIDAPEAWEPRQRKFKTPYEFVVSSLRAAGADVEPPGATALLTALGQGPLGPPSPKGWPDRAAPWATPDAMMKRMAWAEAFHLRSGRTLDPLAFGREALGPLISPDLAAAAARTGNRAEALALVLMSPEFQRR